MLKPRPDVPEVPWSAIADDVTNAEFGYLLGTLLRDLVPDSWSWLLRRVLTSEQSALWFLGSPPSGSAAAEELTEAAALTWPDLLNRKTVSDYGAAIDRFLGDLAFLGHLTGGQASRGTELLLLRLRNTQDGGLRNVFYDCGLVMLVTGYHKGYNQSGATKVIYCFLPRPVSELFIYYLWLVLPFWEDITAAGSLAAEPSQLSPAPFSPYIWPLDLATLGRPIAPVASSKRSAWEGLPFRALWNTVRLSRALSDAFYRGSGQRIGISQWRHLNKAITRKYLRHLGLDGEDGGSAGIGDLDSASSESSSSDAEREGGAGSNVLWNV
ncbi:MAG: hypothetical protein JWP44_4911 [Mucilaginibacter sp.]|nr:hypothetical protein [Mucilaginibacter sp.]